MPHTQYILEKAVVTASTTHTCMCTDTLIYAPRLAAGVALPTRCNGALAWIIAGQKRASLPNLTLSQKHLLGAQCITHLTIKGKAWDDKVTL